MKWVTRDFVHLDRVACPWLIRRYIDRDAEFVFVPWGQESMRPSDAIPFAIPGAELGPHDENGTTFTKLVAKYKISDPSIAEIAKVIHAGVEYVLHGYRPDANDRYGQIAVGLLAVSEGVLLNNETDNGIIDASLPIYDALYANFHAHQLMKEKKATMPDSAGRGPTLQTLFLRGLLKERKA
jgi:hypothetical protein